ncbi:MAG: hypothetical protein ACHQIO_07670 [Nevskiales bacterium]
MRSRPAAVAVVSAILLAAPQLAPQAVAQPAGSAQIPERVLPVAAGALVGAATAFFLLPLLVPATAAGAVAGASTTAGPLFAAVGASIGGVIGYEFLP